MASPSRTSTGGLRARWAWSGVGLALALAALARAVGWEEVFLSDGSVVFAFGDSFYHARRALFSFLHFPAVLTFDACINHPGGSVIPHPPGLDWAVAGFARLLGDSRATFERVGAWSPVAFGTLTVLPVYALGAAVGARAVGLGAALLYALMPIVITYARVGNMDHHAAAGLIGAVLLLLYVLALQERDRRRVGLGWIFAGLAAARAAMLLVWHGGLLYIVPGEVAIVLAAGLGARRDLLGAQALSCLGSVLLLAPLVAWLPVPNGGAWSGTELSLLQPTALAACGVLCAGLLVLERVRPTHSPGARLVRLVALGAGVALSLLALPGVREGLAPAFAFLSKSDRYTALVVEQLPLFHEQGRLTHVAGERRLGAYAYLIPFVPLVFIASGRRQPGPAQMLLFAWTMLFGLLALQQMRYANDYAAAGCVGFALLLARGAAWGTTRGLRAPVARGAAAAVGVLLLAPTLPRYWAPNLEISAAYLGGRLAGMDRGLLSIGGTQLRFAQAVARRTPATPACETAESAPAYGILAHPAIGHVLHYVAQRATPADPFGPYIGRHNFDRVMRFLETEAEAEAVALASELDAPWVLTAEDGGERPPLSIVQRLHREDGAAREDAPHLGRFRLVLEGPTGGVPISMAFESQRRATPPYKLFEVVTGALLEVPAEPGRSVAAELPLRTSEGRRLRWRARAEAGADGLARLRVPYSTERTGSTHAAGPYRVDGTPVEVSEQAVREGGVVRVERAAGARASQP